jgi:hypothetical protein
MATLGFRNLIERHCICLSVYLGVIWTWILIKWAVKTWVGFNWLRMERNDFHYVITVEFNVLLTVHHSVSVGWNQSDALFIQFNENQEPLYVSSITCASSGGTTQAAFGILLAYVSWLWHGCSETATVPQSTGIRTQYTKRRLCSPSWGWASNARNM